MTRQAPSAHYVFHCPGCSGGNARLHPCRVLMKIRPRDPRQFLGKKRPNTIKLETYAMRCPDCDFDEPLDDDDLLRCMAQIAGSKSPRELIDRFIQLFASDIIRP